MFSSKGFKALLFKEFLLELKSKTAIGSIFLYVVSSLFVAYLSFKKISNVPVYNALFWIIVLFAAFQVASRSFDKEGSGRDFFLYQLASPQEIILSKMFFNFLFLALTGLLSFGVYWLFLPVPEVANVNVGMFLLAVGIGAGGLSAFLTLISGIAFKAGNNIGLSSVLGFPIILPFLLTLLRFSKNALDGIAWSVNLQYLIVLIMLVVLGAVLSLLLFPYIWRD